MPQRRPAIYNSLMDQTQAGIREAASQAAPRLSVGGLFVEALARRDFVTLAYCLDTGVRLRALLPGGPCELAGRDDVAAWFRSLFGGPDSVELAGGTVGEVGPRLYMRWRVVLTACGPSRPSRLVEQHVFAACGEQISATDLLCSGFVAQPHIVTHLQGRMPCPERQ
jgi:hypothetical protein